ncbi:hypothetical protein HHA01_12900 [Halomonas halmophila]|uniref:Uncharacterized protein n=1 Tax=Halomonas halmophila TaxID=252 RepID=A0A4Y4EZ21_9GAMM|nr:hypothetical protein HHA01_12900 [Halomonas halmophila]
MVAIITPALAKSPLNGSDGYRQPSPQTLPGTVSSSPMAWPLSHVRLALDVDKVGAEGVTKSGIGSAW